MKKHVIWIDYVRRLDGTHILLFMQNHLMRKDVTFEVIHGKFKGRIEFECEEDIWEQLICFIWVNFQFALHYYDEGL